MVGSRARRRAHASTWAGKLGGGVRVVHEAEPPRFLRVDDVRGEVQFARLGRADQVRQEIGAAVVAREADPRERGRELRILGRDSDVAGQGERQAAARGRPRNRRQRGLRHLVEHAAELGACSQTGNALLETRPGTFTARRWRGAREAFDVASGAERTAGARQHDHAHGGVACKPWNGLLQTSRHLGR